MALLLALSAAACGANKTNPPASSTTAPTTAPAESAAPAADPTAAPADQTAPAEPPKVVTFGTHWVAGDDPSYRDEVTGESGMSPENLRIAEIAEKKVLDELNIDIQWAMFSSDTREDILRSVLANDPVCDIALLWGGSQGTILGQNVMQDLTPYKDIFEGDPDTEWMFMAPVFGKNYFLSYELAQIHTWPLVFNISYIEAVDALKENGETVYPTTLYKRGEWTWSVFKDYLTKINAYYSGKPAPVRPEQTIKPYQTDYRYTSDALFHSAGTALYGKDGLTMNSPEAISAIEYLDDLMSSDLLVSVRYGDDSVVPGWTWNAGDFGNGETVFTDMTPWLVNSASSALTARGESMGLVPFPRPDSLPADSPLYEQVSRSGNTFCALKGVSEEQTRLALEAFKLYYGTIYRQKANSDKALDFLETTAEDNAFADGYDIFHEKIGADILEIYSTYSPASANEYSDILGIADAARENLIGQSIYGLDGSPKYAVNVAQKLSTIEELLSGTESAIASGKVTDNIQPGISSTGTIAVPQGTDPKSFDFTQFLSATDNIDGALAISASNIDYASIDFGTIGKQEGGNGLHVSVKDSSGNEKKSDFAVFVYDGANSTPPTVAAKAELPEIAVDTAAADIDWKANYIDTAIDKDGLDIKDSLSADLSELDVTTPGEYPVAITVTDFAGNTAQIEITVVVK
jgi:hypothetical protein